jgi:hypothetical protein
VQRVRDAQRVSRDALAVSVRVGVPRLEQAGEVAQRLGARLRGEVVGAERSLRAGEPPLHPEAASPLPRHEVGEQHVAREGMAHPERRPDLRGGDREHDREQHAAQQLGDGA